MIRSVLHVLAATAVAGMLTASVVAESAAVASAASRPVTASESASESARESAPLRIMPLGDSITWGVGTPGEDSYRTGLQRRLADAGVDADFVGSQNSGTGVDTDNEGHPGWTIAQIADHIDDWLATYEPDVILLHIGTNDMFAATAGVNGQFGALLDRIHEDRPDAQIFVAKLIGLGTVLRTGGQAVRTAAFNDAIERTMATRGDQFHLVDQSEIHGIDMHDRLHPNAYGYAVMAWNWYRALEPVLNDTGMPWPADGNPITADDSVRCLGATVTLPAYAKGCHRWFHRKARGAVTARVWQLPVRHVVTNRAGTQTKTHTTITWLIAP
jgi:lysophospholipase L1-like esterase